ncbi:acetyl-CoA carboxylase biotin carboxylase subunit [Bacillus horti]|uniref:biotin carboxylase n=1 Tax=Caldalkalibacillus horti TaxID=77523 RepID=A0ABT9VUD3_9BACI|nr:acetyl-CoA carboxylase biotin carboxylase subunit [Bacillus horti]MDQ0164591.1 acetyl-CoA carboxylase biotin carboxylase subunit [Bacillus horti]
MSKGKVLIANRGEIARRVNKTCQRLGYQTIAVYSEADQQLPYIQEANEAVLIGPAPVNQSYLQMDRIIESALEKGATMIHPGYGLLSENAQFAQKCTEAGLIFVGPEPKVIRQMGDKLTAREWMSEAGVPIVPGLQEEARTLEEALAQAEQMGYPVMLKASAGGGGIGMHMCYSEEDIRKSFPSAKNRAKAYFGNDAMYVERYIQNPRHIEVQIAGDSFGSFVHLYERNCSIQRRHQKVLEEAPSPELSDQTRLAICEAAVTAAKAVQYTGLGTVEFIMDEQENFYFLEMNTRIQVEHPVTEMLIGVDLVEWQLLIAEGLPLPLNQEEIKPKGHVLELRVYAEDPVSFLPAPGTITRYERVAGDGIRFDDGIEQGSIITPFYDPMIAKIIVSGYNRSEAIAKAQHTLSELKLEGIKHNVPFLSKVLQNEIFKQGGYSTNFVSELQK